MELPPRTASLQRWSQALVDYAANAELADSLARWEEIGAVAGNLPTAAAAQGKDPEELARTATVSVDVE